MSLEITPIPAFNDNYIWLLQHHGNKRVSVVDPGDAAPVLALLQAQGLELVTILITHHHADHTGGIAALRAAYPQVQVVGPQSTKIQGFDQTLSEGDKIRVLGLEFAVLEIPGHTLDHIAFYWADDAVDMAPILFCGDTLFAAGCGRIFEGTPAMMLNSLQKLQRLDAATRVYCAHEYTVANLRFALAVEPDNQDLQQRMADTVELRAADIPSLPSTIELEIRTNPFLRCHTDVVAQTVARQCGVEVQDITNTFGQLRAWKDNF